MQTLRRLAPLIAGIAAGLAFTLTGTDREVTAIVLLVAVTCYLAAAALGRPWVAWLTLPLGTVAVAVATEAGPFPAVGIAVLVLVLVAVGVVRRAPPRTLAAETLVYAGYGGVALAALSLADVTLGAVVAALALAAHAAWDAVHLVRRPGVVPPALALGCVGLDLSFGAAVLVAVAVA